MTTEKLLAFHGNQSVKDMYLNRVQAHAKADEIIAGKYWENGKGCAVGCTLHSGSHQNYETELGIPRRLAYLEDRLFERMFEFNPNLAKQWPARFLKAAAPGADLELVFPKFMLWILDDDKHGIINHAKTDRTKESIKAVTELYRRWSDGNKPATIEWDRVWRSAAAAADADAAAAAAAADADAADAADAAAAAAAADADAADAAAADAGGVVGVVERLRPTTGAMHDSAIELLAAMIEPAGRAA